ncbi:I78 family peptidase inhibitor [Sphingobium subterraneum]|uniref:Peptidase inhibitor I78 n=1 Tax=Sphingobium subterraneum TaxID=627688 RepID=A0A841J981_9SPHN|nr:I78 family peptidase inhibitor [Sphingobium subterraneum]MBB6125065.1 hypothetical protein [Sphingobium subterraneum]
MKHAPLAAMMLLATGCTPAAPPPSSPPPAANGPSEECRGEALALFIGQTASSEVAARMMQASGARTLRWVAPGMAVTMDYRADRLTVSYDAAMKIDRASCG